MTAWICMACNAHGDGDVSMCPRCSKRPERLSVWLCCECWTEGTGARPDECPACGRGDSWFQTSTDADDPRPARALFDELLDGILQSVTEEALTEAEELAEFARERFGDILTGATSPEQVGRMLINASTAGPRLWTGIRILRALGVLVEDSRSRPLS